MHRMFILAIILGLPLSTAFAQDIEVIDLADTGSGPFGMALSSDGSKLYVSQFGDVFGFGPNPGKTVRVLDTATLAQIGSIPTGINPEDIVIRSGGDLGYVVNSSTADVTVFRTDSDEVVLTIPVGEFGLSFLFSIAEVPGEKKLYVTSVGGDLDGSDENIYIIDIDDDSTTFHQVTGRILLAGGITRLAFDEGKGLAYAGLGFPDNDFFAQPDVVVIDTRNDTVVDRIDINVVGTGFHGIEDVAISADRKTLYVPVFDFFGGTSEVFVLDLASRKIVNLIQVSEDFAQHGIGISPDGSFVVVTNFFEGSVSVVLTATQTVVRKLTVGSQPNEVIFSADGRTAYVSNQASDSISVLSFSPTIQVVNTVITEEILQGDITSGGFISSFDNRVESIESSLDDGNTSSAVGQTSSLMNFLESNQLSGKISVGEEIPDDSDPSASLNNIKAAKKK
ncbi:MAG: YncE family protein [Planctomycetota bacterium]|nr:YncE family protein [Planctomycetota bacterium]